MENPTRPSDMFGSDEQIAHAQQAQRFAKFLAIGASRLLATDPALLGVVEQGQSPVGQASNGRSTPPTIREHVGDAADAPDDRPEVGGICGEGVSGQSEAIAPPVGTGATDRPASAKKGGGQLCMPY